MMQEIVENQFEIIVGLSTVTKKTGEKILSTPGLSPSPKCPK
jgi:hypothetical protein